MRRLRPQSTIEGAARGGSMSQWRANAPTSGGDDDDDSAPRLASNVLPLPTAALLYEAAYHGAALPLLIVPQAAHAPLLANRALQAVSGYGPEHLARLRLEDVLEPPAGDAPSLLRCRDDSTIEVGVEVSEIVSAGRRVGTLYELRPPGPAAAASDAVPSLSGGASLETAGVVHDLNNLLTVLSGHVELLRGDLEPGGQLGGDGRPDGATERLELMQHAAEGAATLARRLLEIARVVEPDRGLIEPGGLAADAIALAAAGPTAACEVVLVVEAGLPAISGDRLQLERVLLNLLRNAADAVLAAYPSAAGAIAPPIEVEVASAGPHQVAFTVRDHGAGISAAARSRVFEPHFTTKPGSGSGLGLSTARALVGAHGGRIEVESSPAGATFSVVLPAVAASAGAPRRGAPRAGARQRDAG